jgi:hypothetical protein
MNSRSSGVNGDAAGDFMSFADVCISVRIGSPTECGFGDSMGIQTFDDFRNPKMAREELEFGSVRFSTNW